MEHHDGRRGPRCLPAKLVPRECCDPPTPVTNPLLRRTGASGDVQRPEPSRFVANFQAIFPAFPLNVLSKVLPRDFRHTLDSGEIAAKTDGEASCLRQAPERRRLPVADFDKTKAGWRQKPANSFERGAMSFEPVRAAVERHKRIELANFRVKRGDVAGR